MSKRYRLCVTMDVELCRALAVVAARRGMSRGALVREVLAFAPDVAVAREGWETSGRRSRRGRA